MASMGWLAGNAAATADVRSAAANVGSAADLDITHDKPPWFWPWLSRPCWNDNITLGFPVGLCVDLPDAGMERRLRLLLAASGVSAPPTKSFRYPPVAVSPPNAETSANKAGFAAAIMRPMMTP